MSRLHALHKTVESDRRIESQSRDEARTQPERIDGFDKHSAGADVARACPQNRRTPFDFEVGAERVTRRPAAFESSGWMISTAHRTSATPCQGLRTTALGRNRRLSSASIRLLPSQNIRRRKGMFCSRQSDFRCQVSHRGDTQILRMEKPMLIADCADWMRKDLWRERSHLLLSRWHACGAALQLADTC